MEIELPWDKPKTKNKKKALDLPVYGTHMPLLASAARLVMTEAEIQGRPAKIIELGAGPFSTPLLRGLVHGTEHELTTYETSTEWLDALDFSESGGRIKHQVIAVKEWDAALESKERWQYDLAFIDHHPGSRRGIEGMRLAFAARLVIVHDAIHPTRDYWHCYKTNIMAEKYDNAALYFAAGAPWSMALSNFFVPNTFCNLPCHFPAEVPTGSQIADYIEQYLPDSKKRMRR